MSSRVSKEEILATLASLKPEMRATYQVDEIGLFGSTVRNEQTDSSDIDILVEFGAGADLFHFVGLALFLEERLQRKVDVVSKGALREELRDKILQEVAVV